MLLDLYTRFGDVWLVELLFDDLLDWHEWTWQRRRVVVPGSACCDEPGYISVGNDYASDCEDPADCVGAFKGESGLDQSPKWDCVGAAPDGSGGDCTGMAVNGSRVLQMGETQSSSLFVADADALAILAGLISRTSEQALLVARASAMRAQVAKLFDAAQSSFMDVYARTGLFSQRLSPTSFYPLLALGAAAPPAQVAAMLGHLLNVSEFCVSADWASNPDRCFWGLPSIAASDRAYMQPLSYVYWRGCVCLPPRCENERARRENERARLRPPRPPLTSTPSACPPARPRACPPARLPTRAQPCLGADEPPDVVVAGRRARRRAGGRRGRRGAGGPEECADARHVAARAQHLRKLFSLQPRELPAAGRQRRNQPH